MIKTQRTNNTQQAFWVAIGSFASFGVSVVTSMILSRYLDKSDYGTYKQVMYVYNTLLTIFTLGLPQAFGYFLPRVPKEQGKDIVNKITFTFFITGLFFSCFLYLGSSFIANILHNENLVTAIRIFSPVPFLLLPTLGLESIYSTYRQTYISSLYTVSTRIMIVLCVVLPVIIWDGSYKQALVGFLVASAFSFAIALYLKNAPFRKLCTKRSVYTTKDILKFSLPLMYAGIWGMIIQSADQFFISRYFGTEIFAEFSNGSMELPFVGMIIGACTTVLYPLFSKMNSEHLDPRTSVFPLWRSVFRKTAMLIYPLVCFCWVFANEIMQVLYGTSYEMSGIYFRIKLIANLFTLIAFAPVVLSIGKTTYYAKVHMYSAILLVLLEYISIYLYPCPYVITITSVICHIGRIFAMLLLISSYFKVKLIELFPLKLMGKILIPSLIFLLLIQNVLPNSLSVLTRVLLSLSVYAIIYPIYSYSVGVNYISLIKSIKR